MTRVAITGAGGQLGRQLVTAFDAAGHQVRPLGHADFDIAEGTGDQALEAWEPDVIVNSAAWTDVDGCARQPERAMRINGDAPGAVARLAESVGALVVQVSTNEVFEGSADRPYRVTDKASPINAYGRSKLAGERAVAVATPNHLIVRTAWLFGPGGTNFVTKILGAAEHARDAGSSLKLVADELGNPTWTPDLAHAIVELVREGRTGTVHAAGTPPTSRLGWARVALESAGVEVPIEPVPLASFERASTPPPRAVLEPSEGVPEMAWDPVTRAYASSLAAAERR